MQTLIKLTFHKPTNLWYALTAAAHNGVKIQKFGNDWGIAGDTKEECRQLAQCYIQTGVLENATFIN